jgi:prophage regulatory protein
MSKHQTRLLAQLAPSVAAQLAELQSTIDNLGDEIVATLAAQKQEAEEREPEPERLTTEEPVPTAVDVPSATVCHRAREVARRLDIHTQTLWKWVREGRFPKGVKIGPMRTVWSEATIAQWLDEQRANPGKRRLLPRELMKRERLGRE